MKKPISFGNRFKKTNVVKVGEVSFYPPLSNLDKTKFSTAIDPGRNPKILDYIGKMGKAGKLNLENGELAVKSSLGENIECYFEDFFDDEIT